RRPRPPWECLVAFECPANSGASGSPAVVRERFVRLCHTVGLFTLLDCATTTLGGVNQLGGQLARHAVFTALARSVDQPAHRQRDATRCAHFDWHLVGGTTNTARLHFDRRGDIGQSLLNHFHRIGILFADHVHGTVDDALSDGLLAAVHDHIDKTRDRLAAMLGVRQDRTLRCGTFTRHGSIPQDFGRLAPYFERRWRRLATPAASSAPRTVW